MNPFYVLLYPFLGALFGYAFVFFIDGELKSWLQRLLIGFSAGIMISAAVWSLLVPSLSDSASLGIFSFVPAAVGLASGVVFFFILDKLVPHLHLNTQHSEGLQSKLHTTAMLVLSTVLHNISEGFAIGITLAAVAARQSSITIASALALSIGIMIEKFSKGIVMVLPLKNEGNGQLKSFLYGILVAAVQPVVSLLILLLADYLVPLQPYLLSFAAGTLLYIVIEELIPEASKDPHSDFATFGFAAGFILLMILSVIIL